MTSGPVNTLAQFWLWRLELRVLSTLIAALALVVIVGVSLVFGINAGVAAMVAFYVAVAAVILYCLGRIVWLCLSPATRDRALAENEERYRREMAAIHRDMQV